MVHVHHHSRVGKLPLCVQLQQRAQMLIVVVGMVMPEAVHIAPEDGVSIGVALRLHLPAPVDKGMAMLGGDDGVHHHRKVSLRGVFHAHGDIESAGREAVKLILHRPCPHRHIGQQVREIGMVLRVEHLVCAGKARLLHRTGVHLPDGDHAPEHVLCLSGVRLVEHPLVACAQRAGLVGIDAGNHQDFIRHLILYPAQTVQVFQHRLLIVRRAGADHQQQSAVRPVKDAANLPVPLLFHCPDLFLYGKFLFQRLRRR